MNVIDVNGVSLIIGQSKILDDISFHVEEGNIHALIGNNGAGKTSLLKILLGLTPSYGGYLKFFDSENIAFHRRYIGSVMDSINPDIKKTALSYLNDICFMFGTADKKFEKSLLSKVGLEGEENKLISKYSLGMKKRLMIACALASRPKLLVLDEPFNGIDPNGMNDMRLILQQLNSDNVTVLITSHIIPELLKVANVFTIMNEGSVVDTISSEQLSKMVFYKTLVHPQNCTSFINALKKTKPNILCQSEINGTIALYGDYDIEVISSNEKVEILERTTMTEEDILLWKMNGSQ